MTGYKQTEVGVIPTDWDVKEIGDIALITTGGKDTQDAVKNGKYPFFVRSQKVEKINSYSFNGEAVLTSGDGVGVGKIYHYIVGKFDFHQRVYCIYNFKGVDGKYFYFQFSANFYKRVMSLTAKSSVDSVRMQTISNMKISIPKIEEQKAIATVLSDTDELIQVLKDKIAKKELIKKGTMQKLLQPKKDWELIELGSKVKITSGEPPSQFLFVDEGIPYFKVEQLNNSSKYTTKTPYFICKNLNKQVPKNSIIFPKRGASIMQNKIRILYKNSYFDTNLMALSPDSSLHFEFLFYMLTHVGLDMLADTTSIPQINNKHINPYQIFVPKDLEKQKLIAKTLSNLDEEIEKLEEKLAKYEQIKQGLMHQLLTGKIRLL